MESSGLIRWLIVWPLRCVTGRVKSAELPTGDNTLLTSYTMIVFIAAWFINHPGPRVTINDYIAFGMQLVLASMFFRRRWRFVILMSAAIIDIVSFYTDMPGWLVRVWWWPLIFVYLRRFVQEPEIV